ncbi:hypothetical protein KKF45_05585 [Patescibacteria group bacterium]|uniref:Putative structural protein n=1 Tax=viral metagenome TaxID=1070528 RepID=A0A6H1ZQC9_9ZZZZ|nr:hypothetical protein [Patescibacteria group bacterium]
MTASNVFENNLALLIFNNTPIATIGDAAGILGSAVAGSLYVSLHTADPGEAGTQATSECAYTSYARVAVARSAAGWTVAGSNASNTAVVTWPACTGGTESATHFGIGAAASGTGKLLASGALSAALAISNGITPEAAIGALDCDID